MGVSLIYLGKNDDDSEMAKMCDSIVKKLKNARIDFQTVNPGVEALPSPHEVEHEEVWFCGHSRFINENSGVRPTKDRTLGGFAIPEIANFVKACVMKGNDRKFRLICCEAAQHQRGNPPIGTPPTGFQGVLGNEYLETINLRADLDNFDLNVHARISHVEGLIWAMAKSWVDEKKVKQNRFIICGLWGAGDITPDNKPITGFVQAGGTLEAAKKMDDKTAPKNQKKINQKQNAEKTFTNGHCSVQNLPDFFGFDVRKGALTPGAK